MASTEEAKAEEAIKSARAAYDASRAALGRTLQGMNENVGVADKLIAHAEEYGFAHTKSLLMQNASETGLRQPAKSGDLAVAIAQLEEACNASLRLDEAIADRNAILEHSNPAKNRAFVVSGRLAEYDPSVEGFIDKQTNRPLRMEVVETVDTGMTVTKTKKREHDRDR